jgi:hypothetical protein
METATAIAACFVPAFTVFCRVLRRKQQKRLRQSAEPLNSIEAALEAWATCQPEGYVILSSDLKKSLPKIATHIPCGSNLRSQSALCVAAPGIFCPEAKRLNEVFGINFVFGLCGRLPLFMKMLKSSEEYVHFLYFWRAFSEATRYVVGEGVASTQEDDLVVELETFRDRVLRLLESQRRLHGILKFESSAFLHAIRNAASMSATPNFWLAMEQAFRGQRITDLGVEEVTIIMLSWLHDAAAVWQQHQSLLDTNVAGASAQDAGVPVLLHVYDVSQTSRIRRFNKVLAHRLSPLKLGGIFHVGVEVNGVEWAYGYSPTESVPGISCCRPREDSQHHFRQSIQMRKSNLPAQEIMKIISDLKREYHGIDYDILRKNCCHFADDFCQRLGAGEIPRWVHRLARIGAQLDNSLRAVRKTGEIIECEGEEFRNRFGSIASLRSADEEDDNKENGDTYTSALSDPLPRARSKFSNILFS